MHLLTDYIHAMASYLFRLRIRLLTFVVPMVKMVEFMGKNATVPFCLQFDDIIPSQLEEYFSMPC